MSVLYNVFVVVHMLGLAALVGGYLAVAKAPRITELVVWGARIQFLSGLILVGLGEGALDKDYDHAKIAVKLVVSLVVVTLAEITRGKQKRDEGNPTMVHVVGGLAVLNVLVAVLWT
ncbi:hypothetical protein G4H71_03930 [Rhodococcus triatomae]|uniref:Integral membrane protein n=1 Tax=Rhodococcus triatomae TaxID=300028 RepID=A0A1G7ZH57_9NOCA|nr:hypothetical protein [Rhodococcus triatomae]QNG18039.1 hypothetical protein G4H72_04110 [Rhodococcus triatomae]QNG22290.1 hypothetical protein G4H71_03930 [Rhodococcus triatomae]SDH08121.1 hypothetical protein SAMN05444695_101112 [Rhodococcus triatomae]